MNTEQEDDCHTQHCFSGYVSLGKGTKRKKINKWDHIKLKSFCTVRETIHKMKRQPTELEKIFTNDTLDNRLIYIVCKELIQLNTQNTNNPTEKNGQRT